MCNAESLKKVNIVVAVVAAPEYNSRFNPVLPRPNFSPVLPHAAMDSSKISPLIPTFCPVLPYLALIPTFSPELPYIAPIPTFSPVLPPSVQCKV